MWFTLLAQASAQAPPPLSPDARFALALFCNGTCSADVMDALDEGLSTIPAKNGFPDSASRRLRVMGLAGADFGMPDAAFIELYGQGVDRPEELEKSQEVLLAWFAAPRADALATFAIAHAAFATAAQQSGGWVEDLDTQRLYGAAAWAKLDPAGPVTDWFVVDGGPQDTSDPDGAIRLVTRGLRRYGDFELVVEDVDPAVAGDVSFVVNALAGELRKRPNVPYTLAIDTNGAKGTATFRSIAPLVGDPEAPILRATFVGDITLPSEAPIAPPARDPPAAEPVSALPPPSDSIPDRPTALLAAQSAARERFARVVGPAFAAGLASGDAVAVKAPFATRTGGTEFMWVELQSISADTLRGHLMNEPFAVESLHKGDSVTVNQPEIFDYIWKKSDGTREGNTTAMFLD